MEQIFDEKVYADSHTAEADKDKGDGHGDISLEKFKDAKSLLKAYNCLEAEFTKRSQRLKRLEGENAALKAELETKNFSDGAFEAQAADDGGKDFLLKYPEAKDFVGEIVAYSDDGSGKITESAYIGYLTDKLKKQAESAVDHSLDVSQIDSSIKGEIIRQFLSEISSVRPSGLIKSGDIPVTPPIKPKTLREAGLLAKKYFD